MKGENGSAHRFKNFKMTHTTGNTFFLEIIFWEVSPWPSYKVTITRFQYSYMSQERKEKGMKVKSSYAKWRLAEGFTYNKTRQTLSPKGHSMLLISSRPRKQSRPLLNMRSRKLLTHAYAFMEDLRLFQPVTRNVEHEFSTKFIRGAIEKRSTAVPQWTRYVKA